MKKRWKSLISGLAITALLATGCGNNVETGKAAETVRLGYFPNLTHMAVIVGLEKGFIKEALGEVALETKNFPNGGLFMEAMSTGQIDIGTVGPGPAMNNYLKNPAHQVLAGAVNGGAVLAVRGDAEITSLNDLDGKRIAIPVIGSTQDIMLRKALQEVGLKVKSSGGTVDMIAQAPADTAALFLQKDVDGAATQEPWGVNLEQKAGAKILLNWDQFAWGKESTNTVLVGTKVFTETNPELTKKILKAHLQSIEFIQQNPEEATQLLIKHIKDLTGKELKESDIKAAMERSVVTSEVNEEVLKEMAQISKEAGYTQNDNIDGFINLSYLEDAKK
ncbi:aliphatic sulfonate ABC transporter substrate-binding protein [Ammoniphilus sp. CFH 90114]|uniref:aliphatic sulfonate ABC transporter substrate-binding protein n=1 Tax=Ammoniphilus sp. CFH 90114 TaxID=2493665 RepID=UPI00100EBBAD|nr:aliphatic sulfonate ABC transporter substrate-binding protein [Ammoniphilus sp. CFH 90114]RXT15037.1 aliphatic sulfonate ABC transporter substrate-binding protein [Ammoniphilus sp. CFH 90114]